MPCRIVFAKPEDLETWPNHPSFRFLTKVRSSSYSSMAAWIFQLTYSNTAEYDKKCALLHGPSVFTVKAVKAKIYGVLYNQSRRGTLY